MIVSPDDFAQLQETIDVLSDPAYEIVLTPPARRAFADELLEAVATAVIGFLTTALLDNHVVRASPSQ